MNSERWKKLERLFEKASALPIEQRGDFIEQACGNDPVLRNELVSLLELSEDAPDYLNRLSEKVVTPALAALFGEAPEYASDSLVGGEISHYQILEKLGVGGMGVVYKARDAKLDRIVALKLLPPHLSTDETAKQRLIAEAKAASAVDHPNIAVVHEIGETEDGQFFIAMAYYEGETLKQKIARGPLPVNETLDLATQIAEGLSAAHRKGIVHRDIKPSNILVTKPVPAETGQGLAKIVDFGIAKLAGAELTKTGTTLGTVAYMSPEQTHGKAIDHRTDLWSLGVCLYEMLSGQRPFQNGNEQAAIYAIRNDQPDPALAGLRPEVSPELARVVDRCLKKNPVERYQQAEELLADLRAIKAGRSIGRWRGIGRLLQKQAWLYGSLVGLLILLLAGALFLWPRLQVRDAATESVTEAGALARNRLAVLPLANYSPDPEDEYFADGMTEELISRLSRLGDLRVIARTSVMRYKDTKKSIAEIGRELRVGTIIEGSVRKIKERVRITVQLIHTQSEEHLWSQDFDTEFKDVLDVQSEIAQRVAEAMDVQMKAGERRLLAKKGTDNPEAYKLYLRGRFFWNKQTAEGFKTAIEYFNQAIETDPTFALAYAGLADTYNLLGTWGFIPVKESHPKAKALANKALQLDDNLAEAHTSLADISAYYDWDYDKAEHHYKRAIALSPNYATAHAWYGEFLRHMGRFDEAISEVKRAQSLDPLSITINNIVGLTFHHARQYDKAEKELQETIEMHPADTGTTYFLLGLVYIQKGMYEEAVSAIQTARTLAGDIPDFLGVQACAYALAGMRTKALSCLQELQEMSKQGYAPPFSFVPAYVGLSQKDKAFEYLEKAYEERNFQLVMLKVDPLFDPLRSDPIFTALLEKMGLTE